MRTLEPLASLLLVKKDTDTSEFSVADVVFDDLDQYLVLLLDKARGGRREGLTAKAGTPEVSTGACGGSTSTSLCLQNDRFQIDVTYRNSDSGDEAQGHAVTNEAGFFTFANENNVELLVKVLDACDLEVGATDQGRFWIFAAGLTNQEVTLTATDLLTGRSETWRNPIGTPFETLSAVGSRSLFPCSVQERVGRESAPEVPNGQPSVELQEGRFRISALYDTGQGLGPRDSHSVCSEPRECLRNI